MTDLGFVHRWLPGESGRTLLLLHGTGGDENDLVPLGRQVAPRDNLLSPRGKVLEMGAPRFFRRLAEGVLDVPDLKARAAELVELVDAAAKAYGFDRRRVVALGYSNGANAAVGMLFERPGSLAGAVLMRPMVPYEYTTTPDLAGARVLVLGGARDPYSRPPTSDRLGELFRQAGADVAVRYARAGHELSQEDLDAAGAWLAG